MNNCAQKQREYDIPCEFCSSLIKSKYYDSHLKICSKDPHSQNSNQVEIPCEICEDKIPFNKYSQHIKSHVKASHHHEHHHRRGNNSRRRDREHSLDSGDRRNFGNAFLNGNDWSRPSRRLVPTIAVTRDPLSGDNQTIESFFENNFPSGGTSRIMMSTRRPFFPETDFFESFSMGTRRSQAGIIQRNRFLELLQIFAIPRQGVRSFESFLGQQGETYSPPQGFKKEELDRNFITAKYDKKKSKELQDENKKCLICLAEFDSGEELRFLECCHRFHKNCIDHWMKSKTTCPICKKDFKGFQPK